MSATLHFTSTAGNLVDLPEHLDFNVSSSNAMAILSALGFDPNFEETLPIPISELREAVHRFQASEIASILDHGKPAVRKRNWADCGREPGYLADRIARINRIAVIAERSGAVCCYFA